MGYRLLNLECNFYKLFLFQMTSKDVEINGVHYINPQFRVMKRFKINDKVNEMYDSIRTSFICVLREYFMLHDLQMEEIILRMEKVDCTDQTLSKYVIVTDFNVKTLKYFTTAKEIRKVNAWLKNMDILYRMVDKANDIVLSTTGRYTECQNSTVHEVSIHKLRRKFIQPLHPTFARNSKICALFENREYTHSHVQQSARCLMNNITATQRLSEVSVDMRCSDTNLELPDASSSSPVIINEGSTHFSVRLASTVFLIIINI